MPASIPASMVNQMYADLGIPNRFNLISSRFRRASRTPLRKDNGTRAMAQLKRAKIVSAEPGLGSSLSPAFRTRMDFSACWMSQGLELVPPPPVRANCRPDMHSSRPLPLPWSNPTKLADLRAPFHAAKTTAARSVSVRDKDKIFLGG